jgi:pSer/pThr/pTyr-binding forkhead associated (FHA) protein
MPDIVVFEDGKEIGTFVLGEVPALIGREEDADLQLKSNAVSREHALVVYSNRGYILTDLSSNNGTFMRGKHIIQARLRDGDEISISTFTLMFRDPEEARNLSEVDRIMYTGDEEKEKPVAREWHLTLHSPNFNDEFAFEQPDYLLGTGKECDIRFKDKEVAKKHVLLVRDEQRIIVVNISDGKSLIINGFPAPHKTVVSSNSVLSLGSFTIQLTQE